MKRHFEFRAKISNLCNILISTDRWRLVNESEKILKKNSWLRRNEAKNIFFIAQISTKITGEVTRSLEFASNLVSLRVGTGTDATRLKRQKDDNRMYFVESILGSQMFTLVVIRVVERIIITILPRNQKEKNQVPRTRHGPITVVVSLKLAIINFTKDLAYIVKQRTIAYVPLYSLSDSIIVV